MVYVTFHRFYFISFQQGHPPQATAPHLHDAIVPLNSYMRRRHKLTHSLGIWSNLWHPLLLFRPLDGIPMNLFVLSAAGDDNKLLLHWLTHFRNTELHRNTVAGEDPDNAHGGVPKGLFWYSTLLALFTCLHFAKHPFSLLPHSLLSVPMPHEELFLHHRSFKIYANLIPFYFTAQKVPRAI